MTGEVDWEVNWGSGLEKLTGEAEEKPAPEAENTEQPENIKEAPEKEEAEPAPAK